MPFANNEVYEYDRHHLLFHYGKVITAMRITLAVFLLETSLGAATYCHCRIRSCPLVNNARLSGSKYNPKPPDRNYSLERGFACLRREETRRDHPRLV